MSPWVGDLGKRFSFSRAYMASTAARSWSTIAAWRRRRAASSPRPIGNSTQVLEEDSGRPRDPPRDLDFTRDAPRRLPVDQVLAFEAPITITVLRPTPSISARDGERSWYRRRRMPCRACGTGRPLAKKTIPDVSPPLLSWDDLEDFRSVSPTTVRSSGPLMFRKSPDLLAALLRDFSRRGCCHGLGDLACSAGGAVEHTPGRREIGSLYSRRESHSRRPDARYGYRAADVS